jgi:formate dehydrogenase maturation protein FdhE
MSTSLDAMVRKYPNASAAAATLRALAAALPEGSLPSGVPHLGAARERLAGGVPALEGEPLLESTVLLLNLRRLAAVLEATAQLDLVEVVRVLEHSVVSHGAAELACAAQTGAWSAIAEWTERIGLDPDTTVTLVDHAARPVLRAGAAAVAGLVQQSHWQHGICPACGAPPLLGELRGGGTSGSPEHERVLRCGRCLSSWSFPRLRCTKCGETNHRQLSYLHGKGEENFRRAEICSSCNSYLKNIAVLAPLDALELLTADLTSVALDIAALDSGLHR